MSFTEIPANWVPPDGLGYSSLRPVRLSLGGRVLALVAILFVLGSLALALVLQKQSESEALARDRLERDGVETTATIQRLWRKSGDDDAHYVSYHFSAAGTRLTASSKTPQRIWRTLHAGDSLTVRYLPQDPQVNHPTTWPVSVTPASVAIVVPAIFVGLSVVFVLLIRRQWRLLSEGRAAPGLVVKARRRDKQVVLTYEFRVLSGAIQRGRSNTNSRTVPAEGSVVCVIYDPDNPRRHAVYPFSLVRLEK